MILLITIKIIDKEGQAKSTLLKISTLSFIYSVLILDARLNKISDNKPNDTGIKFSLYNAFDSIKGVKTFFEENQWLCLSNIYHWC